MSFNVRLNVDKADPPLSVLSVFPLSSGCDCTRKSSGTSFACPDPASSESSDPDCVGLDSFRSGSFVPANVRLELVELDSFRSGFFVL